MKIFEVIRSNEINPNMARTDELTADYAERVTPTNHRIGNWNIYEIKFGPRSRAELMLFVGVEDGANGLPELYGQLALLKQPHKGKDFVFSEVYFDPALQGKGIALELYKLAIEKYGYTIVSDTSQTRGSEKLWNALARDPDINVYAWETAGDTFRDFDPDEPDDAYYDPSEIKILKNELEDIKDRLHQQYMDGKIDDDEYGSLLKQYADPIYDDLEAMERAQDVRLVATAGNIKTSVSEAVLDEQPVLSSWIADITLQRNERDVTMTLGNGRKYKVASVGRPVYTAWFNSGSKGKFWHTNIKRSHRVLRLL
jgi:GNAT superfamily N-acetyltransferase